MTVIFSRVPTPEAWSEEMADLAAMGQVQAIFTEEFPVFCVEMAQLSWNSSVWAGLIILKNRSGIRAGSGTDQAYLGWSYVIFSYPMLCWPLSASCLLWSLVGVP